MRKFADVPRNVLMERLGRPWIQRRSGNGSAHVFSLMWQCSGEPPHADVCSALVQAADRPTPPGLTAWESEMFDNSPFPETGWKLQPCANHTHTFDDFPTVEED